MENRRIKKVLESLNGKNILVTGGLGFIGRSVIEVAHSNSATITVLDRSRGQLDSDICMINDDLLTYDGLDRVVYNSDFIIHLVGSLGTDSTFSHLESTVRDNALASTRLIELLVKYGRRAVFTMVGNDWLNPYTISKKCAADLCLMSNLESKGDIRVLKVMNAYGPRQLYNHTKKIIPSFMRSSLLDQKMDIFGNGEQIIDLIHSKDVATALLLSCLVDELPLNKYIEMGSGSGISVLEVAKLVRKITNSNCKIEFQGKRKGEPLNSKTLMTDLSFLNCTGFSPKIDIHRGLEETYKWYLKNPQFLGIDKLKSNAVLGN